MSRTPGALNKPKFTLVKLQDLCQSLKPEALIPVRIDFAVSNNLNNIVLDKTPKPDTQTPIPADKIEFVTTEFVTTD